MPAPRKTAVTRGDAAPAAQPLATTKAAGALVDPAAMIQEQLQRNTELAVGESNTIDLKNKIFTFPDGTVAQGDIEVVIVDSVFQNRIFFDQYVEGQASLPDCFAVAVKESELVPVPGITEPQARTCADCSMNEFGSRGDAKMCNNHVVMAVLAPDDPEGQIMLLRASPTALKGVKGYFKRLGQLHGQVPLQRITKVSFNPMVTYPQIQLSDAGENEDFQAFAQRLPEARVLLLEAPDFSQPRPEPKAKARHGGGRAPAPAQAARGRRATAPT